MRVLGRAEMGGGVALKRVLCIALMRVREEP